MLLTGQATHPQPITCAKLRTSRLVDFAPVRWRTVPKCRRESGTAGEPAQLSYGGESRKVNFSHAGMEARGGGRAIKQRRGGHDLHRTSAPSRSHPVIAGEVQACTRTRSPWSVSQGGPPAGVGVTQRRRSAAPACHDRAGNRRQLVLNTCSALRAAKSRSGCRGLNAEVNRMSSAPKGRSSWPRRHRAETMKPRLADYGAGHEAIGT